MPFADPEKRREYDRNYKRQQRTGLTNGQTSNLVEGPLRIKTARDILGLLGETINEVRETGGDALIRARCIGFLAGAALKAVEVADLESRVKAVEETLRLRRASK